MVVAAALGALIRVSGHVLPKVLALAFTDLDGDHAFGGNDVLIARLSDTDDDKVPSAGDTVEMGRYPTNLTPSAGDFADWNVRSHVVKGVSFATTERVTVRSAAGLHIWVAKASAEWFEDMDDSADTDFQDGLAEGAGDGLYIELGSPSQPSTAVRPADLNRPSDDTFIDVVIDP